MKHFEDLSAKDILYFIQHTSEFTATTKFDGSNLRIGHDQNGLYVRRENREKYYSPDDYEISFYTNFQRLALAAILDAKLERLIPVGQEYGAEVIVGAQPNVVEYYANRNRVTIVLFINDATYEIGTIRSIKVPVLVQSNAVEKHLNSSIEYAITTLHSFSSEVEIEWIEFFRALLESKQLVSGVELAVSEIYDWPLNQKHPGEFNKPWKEVKEEFKQLRSVYKDILRKNKHKLEPLNLRDSYSQVTEGYVISNGTLSFKIVDQHMFTKVKNYVWKFRDQIKAARKAAGTLSTVEDVEKLRDIFQDIKDKYLAEHKSAIHIIADNYSFMFERSKEIIKQDHVVFYTAFKELERIECEIRRNNRHPGPTVL